MRKLSNKLVLTAFLIMLASLAEAQIAGTYKRLELGLGLGATQYTGDLGHMPALGNTRMGGEIIFRYNFTTYLAGRAFMGIGMLAGSPENSKDPQIQRIGRPFRSTYTEFGWAFEYAFFNFRGSRENYRFSPYIFAGLGTSSVSVKDPNKTYLGSTGMVPMIPFGLGVKTQLGYRFNLALEFRTCKPFSDYVDGLEVDSSRWALNPKSDLYYFAGVSVCYRFISIRCPESSSDYAGDR